MPTELPPQSIREQVDRLERSAIFANSERLMAFLRYVVETTLSGASGRLKESVIGNAVYGREPSYDSRIDSTVRVEARRLRRKLSEYYEGPGRQDSVVISLPVGSYVPWFSTGSGKRDANHEEDSNSEIFRRGSGATVVVLPIRALSGPADEPFADGLTDELVFALTRSEGLRIASRATTFLHKDTSYSLPSLAEELHADAFVQGTVRSDSGVIRVTIELSSPKGFVVWSDRFDVREGDRLLLQEHLAATVSSRLRLDSSHMRAKQIGPGPVALEALAKIGRARQLVDQQTPTALYEALQIFQQVARSAPDYARGHSGIADCYCDMYRLGMTDPETALNTSRSAVTRALQIDPYSIEAHSALATISAWLERDREAAEDHFQKALLLGENARAARLYGVLLTISERHEEAERMFWEARAIEPFSTQQDIAEAISHYQARRFKQCAEAEPHRLVHRIVPEVAVYRALALTFDGEHDAARSAMKEIEQATIKHPDLAFARAEMAAWLGDQERARDALTSGDINATWFARATLAASIDDESAALHALKMALDRRELSTVWMRTDTRFDRFRSSAGFQALLAKLETQRKN